MPVFSFRAECHRDIEEFQRELAHMGLSPNTSMTMTRPDLSLPDTEVEMETPADLETLRNAMATIVDGHVMVQTLRQCPRKDNPMTRDAI